MIIISCLEPTTFSSSPFREDLISTSRETPAAIYLEQEQLTNFPPSGDNFPPEKAIWIETILNVNEG